MKYDVSGILKTDGASNDISVPVELDAERLSGFSINEINDAWFKGKIFNNAGLLNLKGVLEVTYTTDCSRCLKTFPVKVTLDIEESFSKKELYEEDDFYIFKGNQIPLGDALTDNFIVNIPAASLCKDDCKGLCTECGTDLNEKDCGCVKEYINPKFESLKSFFNKS